MSDEKSSDSLNVDNVDNRLVEAGRICQIVWGTHYRKLVCIVDFIDRTRVLVDGAKGKLSNIKRISLPLRWLQVTKFRLNLERNASTEELCKQVDETDVVEQYKKSAMGRRNECIKRREALTDFGRFKLHFVKGQFKKAVAKELLKLRAEQKKITVKELQKQKRNRANTHPVLRRVVGRFRKKLKSRIEKKQLARKKRLRRHSKATKYSR
eukprot:250398_1